MSTLGAAFLFQHEVVDDGHVKMLMIFVGIAAFALLVQAIALLVIAGGAAKGQKELMRRIDELKEKILPLVDKSQILVTDLTPQINEIAVRVKTITAHVESISGLVKEKAHEFGPTISAANMTIQQANETVREANATVREANFRTQRQVQRVDGMVTGVLDSTAVLGKRLERSINSPINQVSSIVEGVKVGLFTFLSSMGKRKPPIYRAPIGTYQPVAPPTSELDS